MIKVLVFTILCLGFSNISTAQPVHICRNGSEYAPYVYWERVNGMVDKTKITGATTELLEKIFDLVDLKYTQDLIPWKRCLQEVADFGKNKRYEMFTDGSFSEDRAKKYYISAPIYKLHEGMWYSTKTFPNNVPIEKPSDLNQFKLCGILGNNYSWLKEFGVTAELYDGAKNINSALRMVSLNRCDFYFNSLEPSYGGAMLGVYEIPKDVVGVQFPGKRELSMHLFISKTSPRGFELFTRINNAVLLLQKRGVAESIYKKYVPGGSGL